VCGLLETDGVAFPVKEEGVEEVADQFVKR
jgi:hypothetical protein